jgi:hypothetical protein
MCPEIGSELVKAALAIGKNPWKILVHKNDE